MSFVRFVFVRLQDCESFILFECIVICMSSAVSQFWREMDKYHDLAKQIEENIVVTSPTKLGGRSGQYSCGCFWCAKAVTYYEYRGESI